MAENTTVDPENVTEITEDTLRDSLEPKIGDVTPKKLTDSELRESQDAMNTLYREMCSINDQIQEKGFDGELDNRFNELNDQFNQHEHRVKCHDAYRTRSEARSKRLEGIADEFNRLPADIRNQMRGGSRIDPSRLNADELREQVRDHAKAVPFAVSAWMKQQGGNPSAITQQERDAADELGFHVNDKTLSIPMLDTHEFQIARDAFLDAMEETRAHGRRSGNRTRTAIRNALSTDTPSGGPNTENYLFSSTFNADLVEAILAYGGIMEVCDYIGTPTGAPYYWPTMNDTANRGSMLVEATTNPAAGGATAAQADPTFGRLVLYSHIGTSDAITISESLLQDNGVMLRQRLPGWLGERLARLKNRTGTVGTGSDQPYGIVPGSTKAFDADSVSGLSLDEIFDLVHSVELGIRERGNCRFMIHDNTLLALRKIKDLDGRYIWQVDARSGAPSTLDTHPYIINQDMPQIGAENRSVIFGDLSAYKWRDVVGIGDSGGIRMKVMDELYALSDQIGFVAFCRFDGRLMNPGDNRVKCIEHPAA